MVARSSGWILAKDDLDAANVAKAEGLAVITTPMTLRACVRGGMVSAAEAVAVLDALIDQHGRRLPRLSPALVLRVGPRIPFPGRGREPR